jgi:hypothetical protein
VSDHTEGKIPTLLANNVTPETLVVLVNAIYFDAAWSTPFEAIIASMQGRSVDITMPKFSFGSSAPLRGTRQRSDSALSARYGGDGGGNGGPRRLRAWKRDHWGVLFMIPTPKGCAGGSELSW